MEIITSLENFHGFDRPCVIALGTFDGLHLGHQDVISSAAKYASEHNCYLAVFTFSNHPFSLIKPSEAPVSLIGSKEKYALLEQMGVDLLLEVPFDRQLAELSPAAFLQQLAKLQFECLAVGENFNFGCHGDGNIVTLRKFSAEMGFKLIVRPLVSDNGIIVSSTEIRRLISAGDIVEANRMLGRKYTLSGVITKGCQRGRLLDFPTANIELFDQQAAIPHTGVYAVQVFVNNSSYYGMANIGLNPTFGDVTAARLETHIFDFSGDIYGSYMYVEFHKFIRNECKFTSVQELCRQLDADKACCRDFFGL